MPRRVLFGRQVAVHSPRPTRVRRWAASPPAAARLDQGGENGDAIVEGQGVRGLLGSAHAANWNCRRASRPWRVGSNAPPSRRRDVTGRRPSRSRKVLGRYRGAPVLHAGERDEGDVGAALEVPRGPLAMATRGRALGSPRRPR
jgi:hypothetical protein